MEYCKTQMASSGIDDFIKLKGYHSWEEHIDIDLWPCPGGYCHGKLTLFTKTSSAPRFHNWLQHISLLRTINTP